MKVRLFDVGQPDREVSGQYTIDTTFGVPVPGDDIFLRTRAYHDDKFYLKATVRRRVWVFSDDATAVPELQIWVQRHGS